MKINSVNGGDAVPETMYVAAEGWWEQTTGMKDYVNTHFGSRENTGNVTYADGTAVEASNLPLPQVFQGNGTKYAFAFQVNLGVEPTGGYTFAGQTQLVVKDSLGESVRVMHVYNATSPNSTVFLIEIGTLDDIVALSGPAR